MPSLSVNVFSVNATGASNSDFWSAVAYIHTQFPSLSDGGLMGYTFIFPNPTHSNPTALGFAWFCWVLNSTASDMATLLNPLIDKLTNSPYSKGIVVANNTTTSPNFYDWWAIASQPGTVGTNAILGSRLLDRKALSQDVEFMKSKLQAAYPGGSLLGHLIAGKGVANAKPHGGPGAVLPAWRSAYYHIGMVPPSHHPGRLCKLGIC
jgi:hypothetical protein